MDWIVVVVVGWSAAALVVGLLVGRVIRHRDAQVPHGADIARVPELVGRRDPVPGPEGSRPR